MRSSYPLGLKFQAPVPQLDRENKYALARSINRITRTAEVTRAVMDEMSVNYVSAEQLASQSMTAAYHLACQGPQTEASQTYFKAVTERYLGHMATVLELGNRSLIRCGFGGQHDDYER